MKKALLVLSLLLMICLVGCSKYGELKGTIIDKEYREAGRIMSMIKSGNIYVPIFFNYPETWRIQISKDENGKAKTTWIDISEELYEQYEIGDFYEEGE